MWATLGDFDVEILAGPTRYERRAGQDFVELPLIQATPQLQWMGPTLQEISMDVSLHSKVVDVDATRAGIEQLLADHEPVPLVLGNGDDLGDWVITEVSTAGVWTTADGSMVACTMALTLKESPGEQDGQKAKKQANARMQAAPKRSG